MEVCLIGVSSVCYQEIDCSCLLVKPFLVLKYKVVDLAPGPEFAHP